MGFENATNEIGGFHSRSAYTSRSNKYLKEVVHVKVPQGLKRYLKLELFPQIHFQPRREFQSAQLAGGCTKRVSNTCNIERLHTMPALLSMQLVMLV